MGYLKPVTEQTSAYVAQENIRLFDKMCHKLGEDPYPVDRVHSFIYALAYLHGRLF